MICTFADSVDEGCVLLLLRFFVLCLAQGQVMMKKEIMAVLIVPISCRLRHTLEQCRHIGQLQTFCLLTIIWVYHVQTSQQPDRSHSIVNTEYSGTSTKRQPSWTKYVAHTHIQSRVYREDCYAASYAPFCQHCFSLCQKLCQHNQHKPNPYIEYS